MKPRFELVQESCSGVLLGNFVEFDICVCVSIAWFNPGM